MCSEKYSQIFWISDLKGLDKKALDLATKFNVQYYDQRDV